jgi:uncharacterized protein YeaO (DUF488 family)
MISIKRTYAGASKTDGSRFLVDRLWPRGIKKEDLKIEDWPKDVAPSDELRKWYHRDPQKWEEFRRKYTDELEDKPDSWKPLLSAAHKGDITLLYSSKDEDHNNAVVLKEFLEKKLKNNE